MDVALTPELERFIASEVASGRYPTEDEVVRDALRAMEENRADGTVAAAAFEKELEARVGEADGGEFVDVDEMWADFERMSRERRAVQV